MKKYIPFKKNYQNQKQNAKPSIETQQHDDKVPKVNKIEMHNEPEDDEENILWNLHMMNNEDAEAVEQSSDTNIPNPQVNVILSGTRMASECPVKIGAYATNCLFNSGASHSCMSIDVSNLHSQPKSQMKLKDLL